MALTKITEHVIKDSFKTAISGSDSAEMTLATASIAAITSSVSTINSNIHSLNQNNFSSFSDKYNLSLATKTIAIAEKTIDITIKHINQTDNNGDKKSSSQVVRHQIAQLASEIECSKQFVFNIFSSLESSDNHEKEISMAKLISIQLMNKVVSECFEMFGAYDSLELHPLEKISQDSKMIQISNSQRDLHNNISKFIIEKN